MDSFPKTFTASIETHEGVSFQHPWHLGGQEAIARNLVEGCYRSRILLGLPVVTVALKFDGQIVDVFDGKDWTNTILERSAAEAVGEWT